MAGRGLGRMKTKEEAATVGVRTSSRQPRQSLQSIHDDAFDAARKGDVNKLREALACLEKGAVDALVMGRVVSYATTLIQAAVQHRQPAVVRYLIDRGAPRSVHYLAITGQTAALKLELERSPPGRILSERNNTSTLLHTAASYGYFDMASMLLRMASAISAEDATALLNARDVVSDENGSART
jgi:tRNA-dihydrouridine synthase